MTGLCSRTLKVAVIAQAAQDIAAAQTSYLSNEACHQSLKVMEGRTVSRVQKLCQVTIPVLHRDVQLAKECNVVLKHFGFLPLLPRCRVLRICEER